MLDKNVLYLNSSLSAFIGWLETHPYRRKGADFAETPTKKGGDTASFFAAYCKTCLMRYAV